MAEGGRGWKGKEGVGRERDVSRGGKMNEGEKRNKGRE